MKESEQSEHFTKKDGEELKALLTELKKKVDFIDQRNIQFCKEKKEEKKEFKFCKKQFSGPKSLEEFMEHLKTTISREVIDENIENYFPTFKNNNTPSSEFLASLLKRKRTTRTAGDKIGAVEITNRIHFASFLAECWTQLDFDIFGYYNEGKGIIPSKTRTSGKYSVPDEDIDCVLDQTSNETQKILSSM